jgi:DNA-directed RNA polymerase subunit RPC12/RpoP
MKKQYACAIDQRFPRVFEQEQAACRASFDAIKWETDTLADAFEDFQCPSCSSRLIRNDNANAAKPIDLILVCSRCGEQAELDEVIEAALEESLWAKYHNTAMEGGDPVLERCPDCFKETYAFAEGKCLNPGCDFSLDDYKCAVCSNSLTLDDYRYGDGHLCSYHVHVISKDD